MSLLLAPVLVAGVLSQPDVAAAAPRGGSGVDVQPRGNGGWKPAKAPKSTTADYRKPAAKGGTPLLQRDPKAKRVRELTDRRTATTSSYKMSDGSVQQEVSALPVHYRDAKGAWQPIDSTVRPVSHGGFTAGAEGNSFRAYFAPEALVRIEQGSAFLQVSADGAGAKAPRTTGSAVSYPDAYPGTDLRYQVGPEGVKESIVLSGPPAAGQTYAYTMTVGGGLTPKQVSGGAIEFRAGESGAPVFTIPAPYMSDTKADASSPYGKVYSSKVTQAMTFDATAGTVRVTVTPDAAWLADKKRAYPATIDPTIVVAPTPSTAANTMILADGPTTNYSTSWRLSVGTTATGAARTLIKFPLPAVPAGTTVSSANLQLYYDQTFTTGSTAVAMQALQANAAWSPATATWSNANAIGGPVAGTATKKANTLGAWVDFPVTSAVQSWVNGSPNNGFVLKATSESTLNQGGPRFEGSIYAYGGEVVTYPKLIVNYGVPGVSVNAPTVIHATGAELSWPAYANGTGDQANDIAEYQVHRSVFQTFTPGAGTLVSPVAATTTSFADSTAVPTPADSTDPYGNAYYYMTVVKTKGGKLIAGPTQLVRLPKAGRTTILLPATAATTLSSSQPAAVLNSLTDGGVAQPWVSVGDNSSTYGVTRSVFDFGQIGQVPAGSRIVDAHLKLWQEQTTTTSTGAVYELHGLTRSFTGTQATWNSAATGTGWTTAGGDFSAAAAGTVSGLTNDPNRQTLDATSIVQGWLGAAGSNHGLMVKLRGETASSPQERTVFAGPKTAEPRLAPQLVVSYLDRSAEATYYAPSTPTRVVAGTTVTTPVTINNTTGTTWAAGREVLTYHWTLPDGTDITGSGNQARTALPSDLAPGGTVTLNAQVTAPAATSGNETEGYALAWDMLDTTTATYLSTVASGAGSLQQQVSVDATGNNQLGLEDFYQYTTTPAGSGAALYTNISSGNTVWNYDLFANPSRGFTTLLRLSYNSLSTFDTNTGFGWSMEASAPIRVGQPMEFHPNPHPTEVVMVDGTGNAHKWTWDATSSQWKAPPGVHLYLQQLVDCQPKTENARAWSMTRPDRTVYFYDCDGYPTAQVDANGNEADYTYSSRQSQNKPTEFLTYITDPVSRQTLTVTYYAKGDAYSYVDGAGNLVAATNLTDPQIIDHVKSVSDISGRTVNFYYTVQGLLGRLVDGAGDPAAKTFKFTYDATQGMKNVKLVAATDPRGNTSRIAYYPPSSAYKWLTQSVTDRLGKSTQFSYLEPGTVTGATQQTTVTDANGHAYVFQIDGAGRMIQQVNPLNQKTAVTWDGDNNVATLTENNGAKTTWTYDQDTGYPISVTDAAGAGTARYAYRFALAGHVADLVDEVSAAGRKWHYTYDAYGNMLTAQAPNGTAAGAGFTTTYTYDSYGSLLGVTDANNHTTNYSYYLPIPVTVYEPSGQPRSVTDPSGSITRMAYGPRGEVVSVTDPLGSAASQNYDVFLRPLDSKVPKDQAGGVYVSTPAPAYDANDNVTRSTAANGAISTAVYDAADRTRSTTLPADSATAAARAITFAYDAVGNRLSTTEPNGNVPGAAAGSYTSTVGYDAADQPTTVTDALGGRTVTGYDDVGNKVSFTDPLKNVTKAGYDLDHRQISTTDAQGRTTGVTYDADGLVLTSTDQNGATSFTSLDANGLVTQVQVPHIRQGTSVVYNTTQYKFDQVGNNTSVISPRGVASGVANANTITAEYDANDRRSKLFGAYDPAAAHDSTYGSDNKPETDYTYDAAGRVSKISQITRVVGLPQTATTSTYSYFDNGWIKRSADPFGIATDYDYNPLGLQTSRKLTAADGTASRQMSWDYYPDGKLASYRDSGVPNGWQSQILTADAANTSAGLNWEAGPRGAGFQGSTYWTNPGSGGDFSWNLTIPQDGNYAVYVWYPARDGANPAAQYSVNGGAPVYIDQSKNAGTWVRVTNPANNGLWALKAGTGQNVVLKPNGAPIAADAVRVVRDNAGDSQPLPTTAAYTYDANGNRIDVNDTSPNAQFDHYPATFDQLGRPTQLLEKLGDAVKHTLTYGYDAASNLLTQANDTDTNTYAYDSRNVLTQVVNKKGSTDPGITTKFTYTPAGQRETQTKGNGNKVTYAYNLDGSLASMAEQTSGGATVSSHLMSYDPNNNVTRDVTSLQSADDHSALGRTVDREYSPNNQVTKVTNSDGKNNQAYEYDSAGDIIRQTIDGADVFFDYDRGRVSSSLGISNSPAKGGYQYDTLGRLIAVSNLAVLGTNLGAEQKYSYDGFDNVTSQSSTTSDGQAKTDTSTYDSLNRAVTTTTSIGGAEIGQESFDYLGTTDTVANEKRLYNSGGTGTKTYDYGPFGERLALRDSFMASPPPTDQTSYYTYNPHQDVEALTNASGATTATYGYTAYGANDKTRTTGADKDGLTFAYNSYRFNSARIAVSTGNLDMGFRTYNPNINQFLSRDAYNGADADSGLAGGRYGFAGGNPISNIEMTGHDWLATLGSIAAGVGIFAGCLALGVATEGAGLILCGIAAGAGGGLAGQGISCAQGEEGACSPGAFVQAGVVGGIVGGLTAGVGQGIAGALPRALPGWASQAIVGLGSGAAGGAADYGLTCTECSWTGLATATATGAVLGGAIGAGAGFAYGRVGFLTRLENRYYVSKITNRLEKIFNRTVADVDAGRVPLNRWERNQQAAMPRAARGNAIDRVTKERVARDRYLRTRVFMARNWPPEPLPDFFNPHLNTWWDMTTPGQWAAHVGLYTGRFGTGIHLNTN
ncbi:DNRLRE domain-containing protein [Actinoplanes sp. NPDC051513]|uniref:DNRLRE domain-containing protein n=1 Tax=Actinoplanes sp. NPDC051513 TaxID=3363908 RepID=UPI0037B4E034